MKFLKKALIISMVICVLCTLCLLPVSADVVDGVWGDPVGTVEMLPVTAFDGVSNVEVNLDGWYKITFDNFNSAFNGYVINDSGDVRYNLVVEYGGNYYYGQRFYWQYIGSSFGRIRVNCIHDGVAISAVSNLDADTSMVVYVDTYPFSSYEDKWVGTSFSVYNVVQPASSVTDNLTSVWSSIFAWVTGSLTLATSAFFANGELTLLGALAIMFLSIGLAWLLVGLIQKFLRLRG